MELEDVGNKCAFGNEWIIWEYTNFEWRALGRIFLRIRDWKRGEVDVWSRALALLHRQSLRIYAAEVLDTTPAHGAREHPLPLRQSTLMSNSELKRGNFATLPTVAILAQDCFQVIFASPPSPVKGFSTRVVVNAKSNYEDDHMHDCLVV